MNSTGILAAVTVAALTATTLFAVVQTPPATTPPAGTTPAKPVQPPAAQPAKPATKPAEPPPPPPAKRIDVEPADLKWLDRVSKDERAAFDELLGWAPPKFSTDLEWLGGDAASWDDLRGKVVVIQSFTTANVAGRGWPARIATALKEYDAKDVRIIALHTPDEADNAKNFLAKKPAPESVTVVVDPKGAYCDALAIYKAPTNIIVDRNGAVRYAALNLVGVDAAVKALVAESFDQKVIVASKDDGEEAPRASSAGDFPPITGTVANAIDVRGKRAPEFHVAEWLNGDAPNAKNKVVVVDFWATWCGPCVASIPHMNELATRFRDDVVCVGLSDEKRNAFDSGLDKLKGKSITLKSFQYHLALDPSQAMYGALNIRGIPHCIVMDRNWIVRWQGHPASLDAGTLQKIVDADKGAGAGGETSTSDPDAKSGKGGGAGKRKKWTSG